MASNAQCGREHHRILGHGTSSREPAVPVPGRSDRIRPVRVAARPRYFRPSRTVLKYAADISRMKLAFVVASAFIHSI
jgi:hypothetical protein